MKVKDERKVLEAMLEKNPPEIKLEKPEESSDDLQNEPIMDVNFAELKTQCEEEARIMLTNAIAFLIPADMIENNNYLKNKLEVDIISLAGMIYQLRTNEVMQKALIDQVNLGATNPRMFEVFGQLSKIIGELNKQLIQTVEAIKETFKTFKNDVKEQRTEALAPTANSAGMLTSGDGSVITRGTKEMIHQVRNAKHKQQQVIENVEELPSENTFDIPKLNLEFPKE